MSRFLLKAGKELKDRSDFLFKPFGGFFRFFFFLFHIVKPESGHFAPASPVWLSRQQLVCGLAGPGKG